ncbi:MAG: glycine cleavage system protein GcvH [Rubellimicrobium sp.]|nr:glycine cleavage system protein GcvH [Rubellimicrobium sp.]
MRFTEDHEWLQAEGDVVTVGITTHAAEQLGDVVFVELPDAGRDCDAGDAVAVVESVKAASDIFAPVAGEIVEVNEALADNPGLVNEDAMAAWFFRIRVADASIIDGFLTEDAYKALVE